MRKTFITTLGLIIAFVALIQISNTFTEDSEDEYTESESNYLNSSNNIEENDYSYQEKYIEQEEYIEDEEYIEQEEDYTYSYSAESKDNNDYNYYGDDDDKDEISYLEKESDVAHIGENAYIANANSYYHAISNCKYLEGANTSSITVTNDIGKYECNCWDNPVVYVPKKQESSSQSSSGTYVYISSGNSYYHKSSSCKFLNGASTQKVDINSVGGKYACNCIKY
ncbi:hypothetical protein [Romboutsia ilealis]|uniref:hypothetical protein n=1 Tax=Romboutsia ilealis TaxID=1115758 RepID=UPI0024946C29|nr:hypothetical protein [Romboutsia ilealis]